MAFTGFSPQALDFYAGLEADNSKAYWTANKATWEGAARDPMLAMLDELEDEFGPATPFRPYRDVRFSADKSPYKTHLGAVAGPTKGVGCYVQLSASGLSVGGGFHSHGSAQTARYRAAVDAPASGLALEAIVAGLRGKGYALMGAGVKTAPRGFAKDHPRIELLRMAEVMVIRELGAPDWLATRRVVTEVAKAWRAVGPLTQWIVEHVGTD
jgi:uncharacterized protein (TIGR02453 family)